MFRLMEKNVCLVDGKINPCDVDYKSKLSVGNISDGTIKSLWNSNFYNDLREKHSKQ